MKSSTSRFTAVLVTLAFMATESSATEGYFSLGYGATQRGQGGAGVAQSADAMSATVNPAGVADVGRQLQFGVQFFVPKRGYTGTGTVFVPSGEVRSDKDLFLSPSFAYNKPLKSGAVLNFALYGNGGMNTTYPGGLGGCGSVFCGGPAGVDLSQLFISATYANRVGNLSYGIAPTLAVQAFSASGLAAFGGISVDPGKLSNNGMDWSYGIGLRAGIQYDVSPTVRVGISGQSKINMSEFDKYSGLFADGGDFDIPASVTAGVAWDARPNVTIMADVQHIFYTGVGAISNSGSAGPMGAPGGAGFGWDDVTVIKLGAEWRKNNKITWRAGYAYATNPIGPEDVTLNIIAPGLVQHHFTFGGTYKLNQRDSLDFSVVYVAPNSVTGAETTPGGPTPGSVEIDMEQFSATIGWTRNF